MWHWRKNHCLAFGDFLRPTQSKWNHDKRDSQIIELSESSSIRHNSHKTTLDFSSTCSTAAHALTEKYFWIDCIQMFSSRQEDGIRSGRISTSDSSTTPTFPGKYTFLHLLIDKPREHHYNYKIIMIVLNNHYRIHVGGSKAKAVH